MRATEKLGVFGLTMIVASLVGSPAASSSRVSLEIDGKEISSIVTSAPLPSAGHVNLGGRNAYSDCSSLYDNLHVVVNGVAVLDDDFSGGLGAWTPWGSPQPEIVSGCTNMDPCMRTNGDSSWPSGVCSKGLYDWTGTWSISIDVMVSSDHDAFNALEFGISFDDGCIQNVEPCAVYVAWGDGHPVGEFKALRCQGGTHQAISSPAYDVWHTVVLRGEPGPTAGDPLSWGRVKAFYQ